MKVETLLSLPPGGAISAFAVMNGALHLRLTSTRSLAACPVCHIPSSAQHRFSQRTFHDGPCGGYSLRIVLTTRRFFCRQRECMRRILPSVSRPSCCHAHA